MPEWKVTRNSLSNSDTLKVYVLTPSDEVVDMDAFVDYWMNTIVPQGAEYQPVLK